MRRVIEAAGQRRIVVALGRQDSSKGFELFSEAYSKSEEIQRNYIFVCAGSIHENMRQNIECLQATGAFVENREISDRELFELYNVADIIWCLYLPEYDQASGIFGRALQFGKLPLIRTGSLTHRFCETEKVPCLTANCSFADIVTALLERATAADLKSEMEDEKSLRWGESSVQALNRALFRSERG
jgi:hypothetical protein